MKKEDDEEHEELVEEKKKRKEIREIIVFVPMVFPEMTFLTNFLIFADWSLCFKKPINIVPLTKFLTVNCHRINEMTILPMDSV